MGSKSCGQKIGVGLYGMNGHQVHALLQGHPCAQLVAFSGFERSRLGQPGLSPGIAPKDRTPDEIRKYDSLEAMLADDCVELVSLCSPRRADQAADAIRCLKAGKHVYAEKPCALSEDELDEVLRTAVANHREFHEMAGTAFEEPWSSLRRLVMQGEIGEVVQVFCQKSYPLGNQRPQDEAMDGGLLRQVGIHAFRMVEHVACRRIIEVEARQTRVGNGNATGAGVGNGSGIGAGTGTGTGHLHTAASFLMRLEGGGVASVLANYLNPPAFGSWGNEHLRIFGTKGFVEATDGGTKTRFVLHDRDCGPLDIDLRGEIPGAGKRYFDAYVDTLLGKGEMPLSLEAELHPLRMILCAGLSAERAEAADVQPGSSAAQA